jgi:hypothetical protein
LAHIADEAATGFLSVYNPTVVVLRRKTKLFPMPMFGFGEWLGGLAVINAALLCLSPLMFRNNRFVRPPAYVLAGIMLANGMAHIAGTIAGRTVESVRFQRPIPGFWSSPLVIAASLYLWKQLRELQQTE